MKFLAPLLTTLALLSLPGCGKSGYGELGLIDASGTVTLDGKPLAGAKIAFEGDDKRSAMGTTNSGGKYTLMYDSQTRGTTPAQIVRITTVEVGEGGGAAEGAAAAQEKVPARYNRQSELKADVSASNKTFNFDLKSAP